MQYKRKKVKDYSSRYNYGSAYPSRRKFPHIAVITILFLIGFCIWEFFPQAVLDTGIKAVDFGEFANAVVCLIMVFSGLFVLFLLGLWSVSIPITYFFMWLMGIFFGILSHSVLRALNLPCCISFLGLSICAFSLIVCARESIAMSQLLFKIISRGNFVPNMPDCTRLYRTKILILASFGAVGSVIFAIGMML